MVSAVVSAVSILIGYAALCWICWYRYRQRQSLPASAASTGEVLVAYASQTGRAAALAQELAEQLALPGALPMNQIRAEHLRGASRVLFVVSTYGEGTAPDMGAGFARRYLKEGSQNLSIELSHLNYAVLALGDREYPDFCRFGQDLYHGLKARGGKPLFDLVEMDGDDREALQRWRRGLSDHLGPELSSQAEQTFSQNPDLHPDRNLSSALSAKLTGRQWLNSGSPGAPTYDVTLAQEQSLLWKAGDILSVIPGELQSRDQPTRDYSIASIPDEGELRLVVRQVRGPEGELGLGSGWLTERAPVNDRVWFRLRSNPNFHSPPSSAPLILIGNGTGIAGLRAHLKAREGKRAECIKSGPNWLLFGERSPVHDALFSEELSVWRRQGHLERIDLAFSRCEKHPRYVQACLTENAAILRDWVKAGAYIYVCGSRTGMAEEVDLALKTMLGPEAYGQLIETHRYRRDIY